MAQAGVTGTRVVTRGERQRQVIVDATTKLLETVPIADLSVLQIAKHAGVTRTVIYFHFESKYSVLAAALQNVWSEFDMARTGFDDTDLDGPPQALVERAVAAGVAVWRRHATLLIACLQARASDSELERLWQEFYDSQTDRILELLEQLRAGNRIRPVSDDLPALIRTLLGMTLWVLVEELPKPKDMPIERLFNAIVSIWLHTVWGAA